MKPRLFLIFGLCALALACSGGITFLVPKAAIVKAVSGQFPTVRNQGVLTLQMLNPVLDFRGSSDRLGIQADAVVRLRKLVPFEQGLNGEFKGRILLDGVLDYQPATGIFVFSDVKVRKFDISDLPRSELDTVNGAITGMAVNALGGLQVYKLDQSDWKQRLAKGVLRGIRVTDDGVLVKFGL
jgi:hypothetical protein